MVNILKENESCVCCNCTAGTARCGDNDQSLSQILLQVYFHTGFFAAKRIFRQNLISYNEVSASDRYYEQL